MGCDIHMWAEVRLRSTDPWQAYSTEEMDVTSRNYYFFGLIAGVRSGGLQLYDPRGFPKDLSRELDHVKEEFDHTPTWLTLQEFKRCLVSFNRMCISEDGYKKLWSSLKTPLEARSPYFDWEKVGWDNQPHWGDLVGYFERWILDEEAEAQLLGFTDVSPEVRFIIYFDSQENKCGQ